MVFLMHSITSYRSELKGKDDLHSKLSLSFRKQFLLFFSVEQLKLKLLFSLELSHIHQQRMTTGWGTPLTLSMETGLTD